MISKDNPIHRLREIEETRARLLLKLAPAYAAVELLATEENQIDVTLIEHHPVFKPIWEEVRALESEAMKLHIDLAVSYERVFRRTA